MCLAHLRLLHLDFWCADLSNVFFKSWHNYFQHNAKFLVRGPSKEDFCLVSIYPRFLILFFVLFIVIFFFVFISSLVYLLSHFPSILKVMTICIYIPIQGAITKKRCSYCILIYRFINIHNSINLIIKQL